MSFRPPVFTVRLYGRYPSTTKLSGRIQSKTWYWLRRFTGVFFLEPKLKELVGKKLGQKCVELDNTTLVISVNHPNRPDPTLSCDKTEIDWPAVEKQLLLWGGLFRVGKRLTLNMSFSYTEGNYASRSCPRGTDKRGTSSATQLMLFKRQADINTHGQTTGKPPVWDHMYRWCVENPQRHSGIYP